MVSLAKREEEVFLPGRPRASGCRRRSPSLRLLQRARDEAHRFGLAYNRKRRTQRTITSELLNIPGVGPTRRRLLLERFGSLAGVKSASVSELATVPGFSTRLAERVPRAPRRPAPELARAPRRRRLPRSPGAASPRPSPERRAAPQSVRAPLPWTRRSPTLCDRRVLTLGRMGKRIVLGVRGRALPRHPPHDRRDGCAGRAAGREGARAGSGSRRSTSDAGTLVLTEAGTQAARVASPGRPAAPGWPAFERGGLEPLETSSRRVRGRGSGWRATPSSARSPTRASSAASATRTPTRSSTARGSRRCKLTGRLSDEEVDAGCYAAVQAVLAASGPSVCAREAGGRLSGEGHRVPRAGWPCTAATGQPCPDLRNPGPADPVRRERDQLLPRAARRRAGLLADRATLPAAEGGLARSLEELDERLKSDGARGSGHRSGRFAPGRASGHIYKSMSDGRFAILDPAAGISGDMLLGALVAAGRAGGVAARPPAATRTARRPDRDRAGGSLRASGNQGHMVQLADGSHESAQPS